MPTVVTEWIAWAAAQFEQAGLYYGHGTDNALDEAAWLVGAVLGLEPADLDAHVRNVPTPAQRARVRELTAARCQSRKPLAYLLHEAWFAGLKFYVDERVLVPRSLIGEFLLEHFEPWVEPARVRRVLDLCTGSGCIAIAAARVFPGAQVDATDISRDALAVAARNVERHQLQDRVRLIESDLFAALGPERYDLILTNPPYVAQFEMAELPAEYRAEPALGLVSGADGLHAIREILRQAPRHLTPHGVLVAEVGNSAPTLQERYPDVPFLWLTSASGDESVFLLTAAQLGAHAAVFAERD
jgi:ribosomal protein L3 glutamine methyltransferase